MGQKRGSPRTWREELLPFCRGTQVANLEQPHRAGAERGNTLTVLGTLVNLLLLFPTSSS